MKREKRLRVVTHSGYKADEYPRWISDGYRKIRLLDITPLSREISSEDNLLSEVFLARTEDNESLRLTHYIDEDRWEIQRLKK